MGLIKRMITFLKEVRSEISKVIWPTRRETVVLTGVVLASVTLVAVLIWMVDTVFSRVIRLILG